LRRGLVAIDRPEARNAIDPETAGLIGDDHIVAEIGQVLAGDIQGRRSAQEITAYKSFGHVVQDLATAWALYAAG